jgi:hypothetical protein
MGGKAGFQNGIELGFREADWSNLAQRLIRRIILGVH